MRLIVTIDTEEDNWDRYSATKNPVENIQQLVSLQKIFDEFEVKPTYLVNYPVTTTPSSVRILKDILDKGKCEIGMHCHPWNTPPFDADALIQKDDTMLCNLSESMVKEKLGHLYDVMGKNFGVSPVSFRAGRWGFGQEVAKNLVQLGIRVDSSVTPYTDWHLCYESRFSQYSPAPFWFNANGDPWAEDEKVLLEVPATIDFLQKNSRLGQQISQACDKSFAKKMHLKGILDRIGLLNKVWLSPEIADLRSMIRLAKNMKRKMYPCINLFFHSNTLFPGLGPFTRNWEEVDEFIQKIKNFLSFAREAGWESNTLAQFENEYASSLESQNLNKLA